MASSASNRITQLKSRSRFNVGTLKNQNLQAASDLSDRFIENAAALGTFSSSLKDEVKRRRLKWQKEEELKGREAEPQNFSDINAAISELEKKRKGLLKEGGYENIGVVEKEIKDLNKKIEALKKEENNQKTNDKKFNDKLTLLKRVHQEYQNASNSIVDKENEKKLINADHILKHSPFYQYGFAAERLNSIAKTMPEQLVQEMETGIADISPKSFAQASVKVDTVIAQLLENSGANNFSPEIRRNTGFNKKIQTAKDNWLTQERQKVNVQIGSEQRVKAFQIFGNSTKNGKEMTGQDVSILLDGVRNTSNAKGTDVIGNQEGWNLIHSKIAEMAYTDEGIIDRFLELEISEDMAKKLGLKKNAKGKYPTIEEHWPNKRAEIIALENAIIKGKQETTKQEKESNLLTIEDKLINLRKESGLLGSMTPDDMQTLIENNPSLQKYAISEGEWDTFRNAEGPEAQKIKDRINALLKDQDDSSYEIDNIALGIDATGDNGKIMVDAIEGNVNNILSDTTFAAVPGLPTSDLEQKMNEIGLDWAQQRYRYAYEILGVRDHDTLMAFALYGTTIPDKEETKNIAAFSGIPPAPLGPIEETKTGKKDEITLENPLINAAIKRIQAIPIAQTVQGTTDLNATVSEMDNTLGKDKNLENTVIEQTTPYIKNLILSDPNFDPNDPKWSSFNFTEDEIRDRWKIDHQSYRAYFEDLAKRLNINEFGTPDEIIQKIIKAHIAKPPQSEGTTGKKQNETNDNLQAKINEIRSKGNLDPIFSGLLANLNDSTKFNDRQSRQQQYLHLLALATYGIYSDPAIGFQSVYSLITPNYLKS